MKHYWHTLITLALVTYGLPVAAVVGQSHPIAPLGEMKPFHIDSGVQQNLRAAAETVHSEIIAIDDARWIRLYFEQISLEGDSHLRITSLLDGSVQELDAHHAAMWSQASAYFNGDMVLVELVAAPGTHANRFVLTQVRVESAVEPISNHCNPPLECGLCDGTDDRVPSNENWAGRLMSNGGCSAAVYNEDSCVVSAGHCIGGNMVMQFNVPESNPDCSINHPPAEDQFPVTSQIFENSGVGGDWAVMTTGTNSLGETIYERYGEFRPIASSVPSSGQSEVWGYGVTDDCILRQTQQYSDGEIINLSGSAIYYTSDVTCGNSGSSILQNDEIIGIVTHCTFDCPPDGNIGTRVDVPAFANARDDLCGVPVDVEVPGDYATIQEAIDNVPSGSSITVGPGTYHEAIDFGGKNIVVAASAGPQKTIIDASGQGASAARFSGGESAEAVLEGFTLTGGTGSNVFIGGTQYVLGGGIYLAGSTPNITDCIIIGNTAQFGGGVFNNEASPTFDNCVFENNSADPSSGGGAFNFSGAQPVYINTTFVGNTASVSGGGMSSQGSSPVVVDCAFIDNHADDSGGAVRNIQGSAGEYLDSHFQNNSAGNSGGAFINDDSGDTTIADSEFCENDPNHIIGAYSDGGGNEFLDTCPETCPPADLNCDGVVDVLDLLILLENWGQCADPDDCPADLNDDGTVDVLDLLMLLEDWG